MVNDSHECLTFNCSIAHQQSLRKQEGSNPSVGTINNEERATAEPTLTEKRMKK